MIRCFCVNPWCNVHGKLSQSHTVSHMFTNTVIKTQHWMCKHVGEPRRFGCLNILSKFISDSVAREVCVVVITVEVASSILDRPYPFALLVGCFTLLHGCRSSIPGQVLPWRMIYRRLPADHVDWRVIIPIAYTVTMASGGLKFVFVAGLFPRANYECSYSHISPPINRLGIWW